MPLIVAGPLATLTLAGLFRARVECTGCPRTLRRAACASCDDKSAGASDSPPVVRSCILTDRGSVPVGLSLCDGMGLRSVHQRCQHWTNCEVNRFWIVRLLLCWCYCCCRSCGWCIWIDRASAPKKPLAVCHLSPAQFPGTALRREAAQCERSYPAGWRPCYSWCSCPLPLAWRLSAWALHSGYAVNSRRLNNCPIS